MNSEQIEAFIVWLEERAKISSQRAAGRPYIGEGDRTAAEIYEYVAEELRARLEAS